MPTPGSKAEALLLRVARTCKGKCILCDRRAAALGLWTATASVSRRLGTPEGKRALVGYSLCRRHARPRFMTDVEDKILAEAAEVLRSPSAN